LLTKPSNATAKRRRRADQRWESLAATIDTHSSLLADQGDLVLKKIGKKRYWYLRFLMPADHSGHRRHCSLYIGRESDAELLTHVRSQLERCRSLRRTVEELNGYANAAAMLTRAVEGATRQLHTILATKN
jgi:hypothetical protein